MRCVLSHSVMSTLYDPMDCSPPGSSAHGDSFFFFSFIFFISWRLITLQYCSGFCRTLTRNLYAGQEATVRNGHGTTDWFQIGKGVRQGCILSPCLFNLYAEYIMRNSGLKGAQAGIKIARRISVTSDMQMTPPLWQKVRKN